MKKEIKSWETLVTKKRYTSTLTHDRIDKIKELSEKTRIPQSVLLEEALDDLFLKYQEKEWL